MIYIYYIDLMIYALSKWISLQTVSGNSKYLEECLRGAKYLKSIMEQLGASSFLVEYLKKILFVAVSLAIIIVKPKFY